MLTRSKTKGKTGTRWKRRGRKRGDVNTNRHRSPYLRASTIIDSPRSLRKVQNVFCPTGEGGGVDPSCSPGGSSGGKTNTPEFKKWFGDSKVVDENEKPLVVYHGGTGDFEKFNPSEHDSDGIWFTSDPERAGLWASGEGANVKAVYVSVKNPAPFGADLKWAKTKGYDRAMLKNLDGSVSVIAFDSKQIKSATGNRGTFDPEDPITTHAGVGARGKPRMGIQFPPRLQINSRPNPLRVDPTRTSGVRRRFSADIKRRLAALKAAIRRFLVTNDELGLVVNAFCPTGEGGGVDPGCSPESRVEIERWAKSISKNPVQAKERLRSYVASRSLGRRFGQSTEEHWAEQGLTAFGEWASKQLAANAFCPTGPGGGQDNSCPPGGGSERLAIGENLVKLLKDRMLFPIGHRKQYVYHVTDETAFQQIKIQGLVPTKSGAMQEQQSRVSFTSAPIQYLGGKNAVIVRLSKTGLLNDVEATEYYSYSSSAISPDRLEVLTRSGWLPLREVTANAQTFRFSSSPEKLAAFRKWLAAQMKLQGLLFTEHKTEERQWWERYIREVWQQGQARAYDDVNRSNKVKSEMRDYYKDYAEREPGGKYRTAKGGYKTEKSTDDFYAHGKEQFLRDSFQRPVSVERVQQMASRTFTDLKGFSDDMATRINRTLTDGLIKGQSPRETAKEIADQLNISESRALTIARTETIRALNEGALDAMERSGVERVGVAVEWSVSGLGETALGNLSPCPVCAPLENIVMRLSEAHGLIPRHPNCLCAWVPANVGEDSEDQTDTRSGIERAIRESIAEEGGKGDSTWVGAELEVDKERPKSIFNESLAGFSEAINSFCPTGEGGGIDPTCSPGGSGTGTKTYEKTGQKLYQKARAGLDGRGTVEVLTDGSTYHAGIHEEEFQDWAADPEPFQDALAGTIKEGQLFNGQHMKAEDVIYMKDVASRLQKAAMGHGIKGTLYRGESYESDETIHEKYKVGAVIETSKLVSTGVEIDVAETYATTDVSDQHKVIVEMSGGKHGAVSGVQTAPFGVLSGEAVVPKGVAFRVDSVEKSESPAVGEFTRVRMSQINKPKGPKFLPTTHESLAVFSAVMATINAGDNCGIGPGGFEEGNTCAKGAGSSRAESLVGTTVKDRKLAQMKLAKLPSSEGRIATPLETERTRETLGKMKEIIAGGQFRVTEVDARKLTATQDEVDEDSMRSVISRIGKKEFGGLNQPIIGVKVGGRIFIDEGHHRAAAALLLGVKIPVKLYYLIGDNEVDNSFCPTGPGGGVDPTCSPGTSGGQVRSDGYGEAGNEVDGRTVRNKIPNQSSIEASLTDWEVLPGVREVPLSEFGGLTGKSYSVSETKRIRKLADAIAESNEISPLIVVDDGDPVGPYILEGGHRAEALFLLGARSMPAMVVKDLEAMKERGLTDKED